MLSPDSLGADMRRREFITLLGGAAAAWPLAVRAQERGRVRRIGVLTGLSESELRPLLIVFREKLKELGWLEGSNIIIEVRTSGGDLKRMIDDAGAIVGLNPDVILAVGTPGLTAVSKHSRFDAHSQRPIQMNTESICRREEKPLTTLPKRFAH